MQKTLIATTAQQVTMSDPITMRTMITGSRPLALSDVIRRAVVCRPDVGVCFNLSIYLSMAAAAAAAVAAIMAQVGQTSCR